MRAADSGRSNRATSPAPANDARAEGTSRPPARSAFSMESGLESGWESGTPCIRGREGWRMTDRRGCPLASGRGNRGGCRSRTTRRPGVGRRTRRQDASRGSPASRPGFGGRRPRAPRAASAQSTVLLADWFAAVPRGGDRAGRGRARNRDHETGARTAAVRRPVNWRAGGGEGPGAFHGPPGRCGPGACFSTKTASAKTASAERSAEKRDWESNRNFILSFGSFINRNPL
jgi:hypothetical protein